VVWHGRAADALAREKGQVAVQTTQVLDYLSAALRACPHE
jgi:NAD(P)H-hydrate epimerase